MYDNRFANLVYDLLKPGGHFLVITGNKEKDEQQSTAHEGPSKLTKKEVITPFLEFASEQRVTRGLSDGRSFEVVYIKKSRFDSTKSYCDDGHRLPPLCWVALFKKIG